MAPPIGPPLEIVKTVTTDTTVYATNRLIIADTSGGNIVLTISDINQYTGSYFGPIPLGSPFDSLNNFSSGYLFYFKKLSGSNTLTIQSAVSGFTIDNSPTYTLTNDLESVQIEFDGVSNFYVVSQGNTSSGGGGVTNVTATLPITSSGGTTPDISTSMSTNRLIGRTTASTGVMEEIQLTTIGSSGAATLSALTLNIPNYSISGLSPLTTKGDIFVFSTVNTRLPIGTINGQILQVDSTQTTGLAYSVPTYPSTSGSSGTLLRSNGTNNVYSTFTIPDTFSQGDIIYASASNTLTALVKDTNATRYLSNQGTSNNPSWNQVNLTNGVSGVLSNTNGGVGNGWIPDINTWTYSSADSPTFVISVNADMTSKISVGNRIWLTQTTDKYFIVTAVGAYSGSATLITVYGGTNYILANSAITAPYYSYAKAPFGFNPDPSIWSVVVTDNSNASQSSPTINVWYNLGSIQISIPIGVWNVSYKVNNYVAGSGNLNIISTLSTANNTESDATWTIYISGGVLTVVLSTGVYMSSEIMLASKTTYYLNARRTGSTTPTSINFRGDLGLTVITATCAYL